MQTQTVKPDAFEGIIREITPEQVYIAADDRRERYFFYPGDEPGTKHPGGLSVNSPCIPYKLIRRCQVTPCISRQIPARIEEIPEGARIAGTVGFRVGFAKYWLASGPEADTLISDYGNRTDFTRQWGLIELLPDKLRGMNYAQFANFHITEAIFPQWPDIPETNQGILDHLYEMNEMIEKNNHAWFKWNPNSSETIISRDIYLASIPQMVESVEVAQEFQSEVVRTSNLAVTLPSTEPGYKRKFDERDLLYSTRAGIELAAISSRQNPNGPLETLAKNLSEKLQPQVAPQVDTAQFGMMAVAIVKALKDEGLLVTPAADKAPAATAADKTPPPPKPPKSNG